MRGRPKSELALSGEEREQLEALVRSRSLPAGLVRRARIVLQAAAGEANSAIAKRLKLNEATVGKWRRRFVTHRLQGLHDELRPGRPRSLEDEEVAELINRALAHQAGGGDAMERAFVCSVQQGERVDGVPAVQAVRTAAASAEELQAFHRSVLHREGARIVGLYLNPPDCALVLSVDEKRQIQALNRTQPMLPMGLGYVEGVRMTTSATAPRPCLRHSMWPPVRSSRNASRGIAIRSSWRFCGILTATSRLTWRCI